MQLRVDDAVEGGNLGQVAINQFRGPERTTAPSVKQRMSPLLVVWIGVALLALAVAIFAPCFVHTTTLSPFHRDVVVTPLSLSVAIGFVAVFIVLTEKALSVLKRLGLSLFVFIISAIGVFGVSSQVMMAMADAHDFPAGQVQASTADWPISEAYEDTGRGSSHADYIRTAQGDFKIHYADYAVLKTQRPAGLTDPNSRTVTINGYFCAKVRLETAGDAVRIMVGSQDWLPSGSIELCPQAH